MVVATGIAWLALAGGAAAQTGRPTVAISASLIDARLLRADVPGQSNPSLPTTGLGGEALGIALGLDVAPSRRIGLDVEFSTTSDATDAQKATKYQHEVRFRETLLSGYLRLGFLRGSRVRVEPVVGASLVLSNVRMASSYLQSIPSLGYGPFGDYERWPLGHLRPAISGGVDFPIGFGRVVVVPTFRLHYIVRDVDTSDQIGLGRWAIRPGIGIRATF